MKIKRTERGWPGHFICASKCFFRRNTLLEKGKTKFVISTVGSMRNGDKIDTIGGNGRYYETMVFRAHKDKDYIEADTTKEISFKSPWSICAESSKKLPSNVDVLADKMHEKVVDEISKRKETR